MDMSSMIDSLEERAKASIKAEEGDKRHLIYIHTNKANNKMYIGQTSQNPCCRWKKGKGYGKNEYFYRAIIKYGWDNFEHIIFAENLTKEQSCNMERLLIALYQSNNPLYGYNNSIGGESGTVGAKLSAETRAKMSKSRRGTKNHMCGKHHTEEAKAKNSEAHKRENLSAETLKKMSEAKKGKRMSIENKEKLIKASSKPIYCKELDRCFLSVSEAGRTLGLSINTISCAASGKRKTAYGYHWKYI